MIVGKKENLMVWGPNEASCLSEPSRRKEDKRQEDFEALCQIFKPLKFPPEFGLDCSYFPGEGDGQVGIKSSIC